LIDEGDIYDLILLDDMMTGLTGMDTMIKLRKEYKYENPIVVVTSNIIEGEKEQYLKAGFNDYLPKPIIKEDLMVILSKYI